jgi:molybdopterin molybdotransferase
VREHIHRHDHASMISVEEALERILSEFDVLDSERRPILDAMGQVLDQDVIAPLDIPPLENSAMDGYAVRWSCISGASRETPVALSVIGVVAAGDLPDKTVEQGTALRIMTGAPIPPGADTVVPFEDTDEQDRKSSGATLDQIVIRERTPPKANVRPAGQDVAKGDLVLARGVTLRPPEIGVLASLGMPEVSVIRRPRVAIVATGDELLEPSEPHQPGKIYDSNTYGVAAGVKRYGGIPLVLGIARDNLSSMSSMLDRAMDSDVLITSAGVSKGDYDIVKDVLARHGKVDFWSVRMRPAKPLAFGVLEGNGGKRVPHIGLPGNPVSALVAFEQFGRPAIHKMMGRSRFDKPCVNAVLEEPIFNSDSRRVYARVEVTKRNGTYYARPTGHQSSNLLTSMARANGLAICPEDLPKKDAGETVTVQMLDWPEYVI